MDEQKALKSYMKEEEEQLEKIRANLNAEQLAMYRRAMEKDKNEARRRRQEIDSYNSTYKGTKNSYLDEFTAENLIIKKAEANPKDREQYKNELIRQREIQEAEKKRLKDEEREFEAGMTKKLEEEHRLYLKNQQEDRRKRAVENQDFILGQISTKNDYQPAQLAVKNDIAFGGRRAISTPEYKTQQRKEAEHRRHEALDLIASKNENKDKNRAEELNWGIQEKERREEELRKIQQDDLEKKLRMQAEQKKALKRQMKELQSRREAERLDSLDHSYLGIGERTMLEHIKKCKRCGRQIAEKILEMNRLQIHS